MASRNSVRGYVDAIINVFPSALRPPVRWVADRLFGVWDEIYGVLSLFRPVWLFFFPRLIATFKGIIELAKQARATAYWIVQVFVPRWARWAIEAAIKAATAAILAVHNTVKAAAAALANWARQELSKVWGLANGIKTWAIQEFQKATNRVNWIIEQVRKYLTQPTALVDWIFAALWARFWRFLNDHAEAIAGAAWNRRDTIMAQALRRFEAFLMRVL